ncbi:MAG: DUF2971 domain-containing protein [Chlorobaculum sp.]|nr:DUF2971 domain-containing protein [Chlorobaculum sp.]
MSLLSHYTTYDGLKGISTTKAFWATNFLDLNDTSEFSFAYGKLFEAASEIFIGLIPEKKRQAGIDIEIIRDNAINKIKEFARSRDGYGDLYVTSFAIGKSDDHNERGISTLWDIYNKHKGYCLQFEQSDVKRMIKLELLLSSYELLEMAEVKYGINKNECDFQELAFQFAQQFLLLVIRTRTDVLVEPQWNRIWPESVLFSKMMNYCATHKDPCFEDEREVRIIAYPSAAAQGRIFTGIASQKKIETNLNGKKYIVIGGNSSPGIHPRRVIVGTKADKNIDSILANYSPKPEIAFANMPIA